MVSIAAATTLKPQTQNLDVDKARVPHKQSSPPCICQSGCHKASTVFSDFAREICENRLGIQQIRFHLGSFGEFSYTRMG